MAESEYTGKLRVTSLNTEVADTTFLETEWQLQLRF